MVKVGDRLVVHGFRFLPAIVERIEETPGRIVYHLDWGEYGKSKVYADQEGKVWVMAPPSN